MWAASRVRARTEPVDHDGERQVERRGGFAMGEAGEHDQQQRLAQFERQAAHADRHRAAAATVGRRFDPAAVLVDREPSRMAAIEANKLGEGAHARRAAIPAGAVDQGQRRLTEQLFDQGAGGDVVEDETIVAHEGEAKSPQRARVVRPFPDRGHQLGP